jgi:broad specificity phosphatase PhoE
MSLEKFIEGKIERKKEFEEKLFKADLRIDFFRHGKPEYTEEELKTGRLEGTLKESGKGQIIESVQKLAKDIDKDKEIIVIWTSPKKRAQERAEIVKNVLKKEEIEILAVGRERKGPELRTTLSLKDVGLSEEFIKELLEKDMSADWMEYWTGKKTLPKEVERPEEVKKRTERLITYFERIARNIQPKQEKKLHFICIGHEEGFRDLLEEGFGIGTKRGESPTYGEILRMDIFKSAPGRNAVLELNYRDKKAKLIFNKETREFRKISKEE